MFFRIIRQAMIRQGRIVQFSVLLSDVPGALAGLLEVIAAERGNILGIRYAQGDADVPLGMARVELELEGRGKEHAGRIREAVGATGYDITTVR
jgi:threonine dehydratase